MATDVSRYTKAGLSTRSQLAGKEGGINRKTGWKSRVHCYRALPFQDLFKASCCSRKQTVCTTR